MAKKRDKSLGDEFTQLGDSKPVSPPESERSLGDQSTYGDAGSSISDLSELSDDLGDEMPIVDLAERYTIQERIGKGGMGEVLRAIDTRLDRPVAIKRIRDVFAGSKKALARFLTEAKSIAALSHFNIVQIYDYGRDKDGPFIIMELVEGKSLHEKLKDGPLELETSVDITCQLCDALSKAHEEGIIHRDIKPANILMNEDGEPKLTDFGLARQEADADEYTKTGVVIGTFDYMPPEQRRDATAIDASSDLWSLAATCYQMITGDVPRVIDLDAVPQNLRSTFAKALKQNPSERFSTAAEFKAELRKGMATTAVAASADLAVGVCPSCNTANDANRKFCRECRASLIEPCLSCESDNPVWEDVCGECGNSQHEKQAEIREELTAVIETSLELAGEHQYENAMGQLKSVQKDTHVFASDIREQATQQIELIAAQWDKQYILRDRLLKFADQHEKAHDYGAVIRELEKIPPPMRKGKRIASQLSNAIAARDELSSLHQQISSDIKNKQLDGLLEKTTRFLELMPRHSQVQKVHDQLLKRQQHQLQQRQEQELRERQHEQEVASRVVALLQQAERNFEGFHDDHVVVISSNWPPELERPDRIDELHKMASDRLVYIAEMKKAIGAETIPASKVDLIEQYLQVRPGDIKARQYVQSLRQQIDAEFRRLQDIKKRKIQAQKWQEEVAERNSRLNKGVFQTIAIIAGISLLVIMGFIIASCPTSQSSEQNDAARESETFNAKNIASNQRAVDAARENSIASREEAQTTFEDAIKNGNLHLDQSDYDKADHYFSEARKAVERLGREESDYDTKIARAYARLGDTKSKKGIYFSTQLGKPFKAQEYYLEAKIHYDKAIFHNDANASWYRSRAEVHKYLGNDISAKKDEAAADRLDGK